MSREAQDDLSTHARVVVGLGNPGRRYVRTRHNLGFMVVDSLADHWNVGPGRKAFGGQFAECCPSLPQVQGPAPRVMLLKPLTYMNQSGQSKMPGGLYSPMPAVGRLRCQFVLINANSLSKALEFGLGIASSNYFGSLLLHTLF